MQINEFQQCSCLLDAECIHIKQVSTDQVPIFKSSFEIPEVAYLGSSPWNSTSPLFVVFKSTVVTIRRHKLWCHRHMYKECVHTMALKNTLFSIFGITPSTLTAYNNQKDDKMDSTATLIAGIKTNLSQGRLPLPTWCIMESDESIS